MATILRELPGQTRVPFLPPERVRRLRDARVRATVAHAAATVPYYRDLFRERGIDPREVRTAEDLLELPLLDKEAVRAEAARFRSEREPGAARLRTWGSTGLALDVWHDRRSLLANVAYSERERAVDCAFVGRRTRYAILLITRSGSTPRTIHAFYAGASFRPLRPRRHYLSVEADVDAIVEEIGRVRPAVVEGYGAHLEAVFRTLAARGAELPHRPAVVHYGAERMEPAGRALIEQRFGIPVVAHYSAAESLKIGFTCERRDGYHLHEDLCHVSIRRPDGRPTAGGEVGEVVVSNLVNRATVLLNYRLGDLAAISGRRCPCGRTSAMLEELEGRVARIIHLPDGTLVHEAAIGTAILASQEIVRSRLVQLEPARFELLLETHDAAAFERATSVIVPRLRDVLRGAEVVTARAASLAPEGGGKATPIVVLPEQARSEPR